MITEEMVKDALGENLVKFGKRPLGLTCKIGNSWFYFGSSETENMTPEEYLLTMNHNTDDIAADILAGLDSVRAVDVYEYNRCEEYLKNIFRARFLTTNGCL